MRLVSDDQTADVVEGIMVNVPSREARGRLVRVATELQVGTFGWPRTD